MVRNFEVALKAPNGTRAICFDGEAWVRSDIRTWLLTHLNSGPPWTNHMLYNDEPPDGPVHTSSGHCKGVLAWNDHGLGWLIHSIPKWPARFPHPGPIPDAECHFGQSFAWITLPIDRLADVARQLRVAGAHVYSDSRATIAASTAGGACEDTSVIRLASNLVHVSKNARWGKDLYDDLIVPYTKTACCVTETWSRPGQAPTAHVKRAVSMRWPDGTAYHMHEDHSKIALALSPDDPWVFVGDINAMESQRHRGGGGVLIYDPALWRAMLSIVQV